MTISVVTVILAVSAVLYFILPVDEMRERTSNQLSGSKEESLDAFGEVSEGVKEIFGPDDPLTETLIKPVETEPTETNDEQPATTPTRE